MGLATDPSQKSSLSALTHNNGSAGSSTFDSWSRVAMDSEEQRLSARDSVVTHFDESLLDLSNIEVELAAYANNNANHSRRLFFPADDDDNDLTTESCTSFEDDEELHFLEGSTSSSSSSLDNNEFDSFCDEDDHASHDSSYCSLYKTEEERSFLARQGFRALGERRVQFDCVEIREYAVTVGDHPWCRDSCPLTLEWSHAPTVRKEITAFEYSRFFLRSSFTPLGAYCPRRLTLEERRRRVQEVMSSSAHDKEEVVQAVRLLESQMALNKVLQELHHIFGSVGTEESGLSPAA